MIIVLLIVALGDFPFPMYGRIGTFDTIKECHSHIANEVPQQLRERFSCLQVVRFSEKEA